MVRVVHLHVHLLDLYLQRLELNAHRMTGCCRVLYAA